MIDAIGEITFSVIYRGNGAFVFGHKLWLPGEQRTISSKALGLLYDMRPARDFIVTGQPQHAEDPLPPVVVEELPVIKPTLPKPKGRRR